MPILTSQLEAECQIEAEYYIEPGDEFNEPSLSDIKITIDYDKQDKQTKEFIRGLIFEDIEERGQDGSI